MKTLDRFARQTATALCPPADRRWIEAMFAELPAIASEGRRDWIGGAASIVLAAIGARLDATLSAPMRWAAAIWMHFVIAAFALSYTEIELLMIDDDVCRRLAYVATAGFIAAAGAAMMRALRGHGGSRPAGAA